MNMRTFSIRIILMMTCAVLLAGARGQDAEAAAKVSDNVDALLSGSNVMGADNAEDDAVTVNTEDDGTVYEAKKVAKKTSTAKSSDKKASAKKDTKSTAKVSDTKSTKTSKNTKTDKSKKSETKSSSNKKTDSKDKDTVKSSDKDTKDKDTKSSDDKKNDKSSKKEDSKKDNKDSKDAKNNEKSDSTETEEETAEDTETPTHYTVHTTTGAHRLADEYQDYTYEMCEKYGIAEYYDLILIQMCCESSYNLHAVGASRYYGLMQISSASFSRLQAALGLTDIREPHQNIEAGVYLMSCLIQKYGDAQMALVCYHRGESAARRGIRSDSYSAKIVAMQSTLEVA